jgi:hypothetical protein
MPPRNYDEAKFQGYCVGYAWGLVSSAIIIGVLTISGAIC